MNEKFSHLLIDLSNHDKYYLNEERGNMLIQFRFSNFRSFREDSILDFSATKITEHATNVFKVGRDKILPAAVVFGANASGKSNVLASFRFMASYVIQSFGYGAYNKEKENNFIKPGYAPFRFNRDSMNEDSVFEVYFIASNGTRERIYNYGFAINQDRITEEWLNIKSKSSKEYKRVFYRSRNELDLSGLDNRSSRENIKAAIEDETLIVSLGAKLRIAELKTVRDWFLNIEFADFGNPLENIRISSALPSGFSDDRKIQQMVLDYLSAFDKSIIGFEVEKSRNNGNCDNDEVSIRTVHSMDDGTTASIPFSDESAGTIKMFSLFSAFHNVIENGSVLVVDELNSRLHPLLVRNFLLSFLNPEINRNHAQIIFTTHDTWMLRNDLLRRDEIWFTEKNDKGESILYSLADFTDETGTKIRKDENYEKNYLLGKYGAIPALNAFSMQKEEYEE